MLNKQGLKIKQSPVSPENLGVLVDLVSKDVISGKIAKEVFEIMVETSESPLKIVEEKGLKQVTDVSAIETFIDELIANNPDNVEAYKGGRNNLLGWFVGQTLKHTQGKANPAVVSKIVIEKLS